jgi:15-cis-phytoene synthase
MGERRPLALARAVDLGVAMQFSNIARDVVDDAKMGRVYLPEIWLAESNVTKEQVLLQPQGAGAVASRLVDEAESIYSRAAAGIAMLPRTCRASINTARLLYREIGQEAKRVSHRRRAVVPTRRKLALVANAVAQTPWLSSQSSEACVVEGQFLLDAVAQTAPPEAGHKGIGGQIDWVMKMFLAVESRRS